MSSLEPRHWILEGVMTTLAPHPVAAPPEQRVNIAPMGPIVDEQMQHLVLRPFTSSTTYRNLKANGQGVFHVTDDALLVARAAIGQVVGHHGEEPGDDDSHLAVALRPADRVLGLVISDACRYYEFEVERLDDRDERTRIEARVVNSGRLRDFFGFNRARHAVLEAAILATRVHLTGPPTVLAEYERLQVMVDKTGSDGEQQAMNRLRAYVQDAAGAAGKRR